MTRVIFKHEDDVDGVPIGPVGVYEDGEDPFAPVPFDPDREVVWYTLPQAQAIAAEHGVTLEET